MTKATETHVNSAARVVFACSAGGHLAQSLRLESWSGDVDITWVTFNLPVEAVQASAAVANRRLAGDMPSRRWRTRFVLRRVP
jgi:hypothetical protein